ncbi:hypothetical protein NP493_5g05018 [Ridgeia piscesae]|uniref:Protein tyrosine phosphatase n=1 Tax=Ridgeia piscesae TaxID=27915 RepID=A0AAD9PFF4_RIDPI|nr:hypothetical protein NP493_5g05018 [Ridgeia piscesae]
MNGLVDSESVCHYQCQCEFERDNCVTHIRIQNTGECYDLYGGEQFATLTELVQHYMENWGELKEKQGKTIQLEHPLWFHAKIPGKTAESLLTEKGRNGSYLVRESFSKPGDFVLSVRMEDRVTHIMIKCNGLGRQESKEFTEKTEGRTAANKPKNRYRNILPWLLTVVSLAETTTEYYRMREFELSFKSSDPLVPPEPSRKVYHFHFTGWPDHGVPSDPGCVISFLQDIGDRQDSIPDAGPIVVHCRTGTVLIIDMILQQIKQQGLDCVIDVQKVTLMVRAQRSGMVQTEAQYRFIYMAVRHYIDTTLQCMQAEQEEPERPKRNSGQLYENVGPYRQAQIGSTEPSSGSSD